MSVKKTGRRFGSAVATLALGAGLMLTPVANAVPGGWPPADLPDE